MINATEQARIEAEAEQRVIVALLGHANTTAEHRALVRVAARAGLLWTCTACRQPNYATTTECCGKPRPAGEGR